MGDDNATGGFREIFLPEHIVTVDNFLYDDLTKSLDNCFVQFQNGNPRRRRPVRRIRRGEAAGLEMPDGDPCGICFSDVGMLTGCQQNHICCGSCLRFGLRTVVGDVTATENLLCGCLSISDKFAFETLAKQADTQFQALLRSTPEGVAEKQEFEMELALLRRAFQVYNDIPANIFSLKVSEWFELVRRRASEHLYYACSQPSCDMSNWILRADFDARRQNNRSCNWTCKAGHRNSVLPSQEEINEINRNILSHPEHYGNAGHDGCPLRRFRLCPECVAEGLLTFAVHEAGCKHWPGSQAGHRHSFCFHCQWKWGTQCNHSTRCVDPGIQQVRRTTTDDGNEVLEIGFVNGEQYIKWIQKKGSCPDTTFSDGTRVLGATRQGQLGMEDRAALKATMDEGTT